MNSVAPDKQQGLLDSMGVWCLEGDDALSRGAVVGGIVNQRDAAGLIEASVSVERMRWRLQAVFLHPDCGWLGRFANCSVSYVSATLPAYCLCTTPGIHSKTLLTLI